MFVFFCFVLVLFQLPESGSASSANNSRFSQVLISPHRVRAEEQSVTGGPFQTGPSSLLSCEDWESGQLPVASWGCPR